MVILADIPGPAVSLYGESKISVKEYSVEGMMKKTMNCPKNLIEPGGGGGGEIPYILCHFPYYPVIVYYYVFKSTLP